MKNILIVLTLLSTSSFAAENKKVEKRTTSESCKKSGFCCGFSFGGYKCKFHVMPVCDGRKEVQYEDNRKVSESSCR